MVILINFFPVWAIILSGLAYIYPAIFVPLKTIIVPLLSLVMFSMGMTLKVADFMAILKKPLIIALAVAIQYCLMPLLAYIISRILALPVELMTGMVLVGASAGGTASNVMCYLAKGNVALSILMTLASTLLAVALTPALTFLYLGQVVPVPVLDMLNSILFIVLLPVGVGIAINSYLKQSIVKIQRWFPFISCLSIILIIAIIVALNQKNIELMAFPVLLAVMLHNLAGLTFGYLLPYLFRFDPITCRTVCIEVAMQNSGLSVALAIKYFGIAAALPGALFSIWHNISGSLLALFWRKSNN